MIELLQGRRLPVMQKNLRNMQNHLRNIQQHLAHTLIALMGAALLMYFSRCESGSGTICDGS